MSGRLSGAPRDWLDLATRELKGRDPAGLATTTPEGIRVKALYTAEDVAEAPPPPGVAPFTRGVRATMYKIGRAHV